MFDLISGAAFSASQLTEAAPSCLIPPFGNIKNDDLGDKQTKFLVAASQRNDVFFQWNTFNVN